MRLLWSLAREHLEVVEAVVVAAKQVVCLALEMKPLG
jgi:hypothetical protein